MEYVFAYTYATLYGANRVAPNLHLPPTISIPSATMIVESATAFVDASIIVFYHVFRNFKSIIHLYVCRLNVWLNNTHCYCYFAIKVVY